MVSILYLLHAYNCFSLHSARATRFYQFTPKPGYASFESVKYPGMYLLVKNGKLRLGRPLDRNEEFEVEHLNFEIIALKSSGQCYVAFDANGKAMLPCRTVGDGADIRLRMVHIF